MAPVPRPRIPIRHPKEGKVAASWLHVLHNTLSSAHPQGRLNMSVCIGGAGCVRVTIAEPQRLAGMAWPSPMD